MLKLHGMKKTDCQGDAKHTDRECYVVECLAGTFAGFLCPKCLLTQMKLRSSAKNGQPETMFDKH